VHYSSLFQDFFYLLWSLKKWNCASQLRISIIVEVPKMLCCQLCSTCYIAVQINNSLKTTLAIKVATIKIMMNGSNHIPTTKSTLFAVRKDEWNTKEGTGKSMKNALYLQWYGKRLEWWWTTEKSTLYDVAFTIIITLVWRHQAVTVSQSVENSIK